MRDLLCGIAVSLFVAAGGAAADQAGDNCGKRGTTRDIALCFRQVYEKADADLDALYRRLGDSLADASERALLQQAERDWVQYRDRECEFETAGTRQGTIHPIVVSDCLTEKTKARIEELQRQLNCGDGDTGCLHERRQ